MKNTIVKMRIYIAVFLLMFLLGPLVKIDNHLSVSNEIAILINLLVFCVFMAGLSCWALAIHADGIKGLFKGFIAAFFGFADSAVLYSAYQSIGKDIYIGAIVTIILLAVLHWLIIEKLFLIKQN